MPYKFRITADKLSRNSSIKVLKQDKGKEVVMIDRKTYTEKYLSLLHTNSFIQLDHDLTKVTEEKIQKSILKIKKNLTKQECNRLYPTGSSPEKFYGTTKQHKLRKVNSIDDLHLKTVISNVGTASYQLVKYLAKSLLPLSKPQYSSIVPNDLLTSLRKNELEVYIK